MGIVSETGTYSRKTVEALHGSTLPGYSFRGSISSRSQTQYGIHGWFSAWKALRHGHQNNNFSQQNVPRRREPSPTFIWIDQDILKVHPQARGQEPIDRPSVGSYSCYHSLRRRKTTVHSYTTAPSLLYSRISSHDAIASFGRPRRRHRGFSSRISDCITHVKNPSPRANCRGLDPKAILELPITRSSPCSSMASRLI